MRFMKLYLLLISIVLLIGCGDDEVVVPQGVLPKDSMAVVLAEMHAVEALMNERRSVIAQDSANPYPYYKGVFEENNISEEYYNRSYAWYLSEPKVFLEVYEKTLVLLNEEQARLEAGK